MQASRWKRVWLGALLAAATTLAYAQYQGPGGKPAKAAAPAPISQVSEVRQRGRDDQRVTLTGYVVKKVGWEKYLFRDASGEIRIEIDDDVMPTEPFDEKTRVEIVGEIEKDFLQSVEIDVKSIRLLK